MSSDLATRDVITPDEVIGPAGDTEEAWDEPCPMCGSHWSAGPERDRWGRQHCWRCGYAAGQNAAPLIAGAPAQPDWAQLVNDAVAKAMSSQPQIMAEAMTAALGREGMADLARTQQENLGMSDDAQQRIAELEREIAAFRAAQNTTEATPPVADPPPAPEAGS